MDVSVILAAAPSSAATVLGVVLCFAIGYAVREGVSLWHHRICNVCRHRRGGDAC
jgi:hypothetical protein